MPRRRVAVVSSCAPPLPGQPVTGGGLRTAQLIATLKADKHSVVTLIEAGALPDDAPEELQGFTAETLGAQLRAAKPAVIVLEQWALAQHLGDPADGGAPDVPLVIDLHGSLLLENVYRRGTVDLTLDGKTKLEALRRADLLLTPAAAQIHHFASWATLAGFDPRELPLALLPLATQDVGKARSDGAPKLRMVYGGARWPWIDSLAALTAAAEVVAGTKGARLDVFTYEPPRHGLPFEEDLGTWPEVDDALTGRGKRVAAHGRTPHAEWLEFITDKATVALDLWEPNPERMLASTTRTIEFLAAGLPVITVSGACWAEELVATGAGWTVPPGDADALKRLLTELADDPTRIAEASAAATQLATLRADRGATGQALLDFVQTPTRPPRAARSIVEAIVAVRQAHLDETLRSREEAHAAEHERLVAAHHAETAELREKHAAEVAEIRGSSQAELKQAREEHKAEIKELARAHKAELEEQRNEGKSQIAEHRATISAMTADHRAQLAAAADEARADRERAAKEADARLARAEEEAQRVATANDARFAEQAAAHKDELESLRTKFEGLLAERQSELDAERATLAERTAELRTAREQVDGTAGRWEAERDGLISQRDEAIAARDAVMAELAGRDEALREAIEGRDTWQGRWKADRAAEKEERTRLQVEAQAALTSREMELRAEADRRVEETRAGLQAELDAMAARKVVRLADSVQATIGGTGKLNPGGRIAPAARLAKLWMEHALDREHD